MILDHIGNSSKYTRIDPKFSAVFRFLTELDMSNLPEGRIEIDGEALYAIVVDMDGKGKAGTRLETHKKYIDIQYQVEGTDCIGWTAIASRISGSGYDPEQDVEFYDSVSDVWINVPKGCFAVFYPEDAHAPLGGKGHQKKIVIKIAV